MISVVEALSVFLFTWVCMKSVCFDASPFLATLLKPLACELKTVHLLRCAKYVEALNISN